MTATAPAAVLVPIQPAFSDAERLALAGFLAGYRGLTRQAYALDLCQFTTWCRLRCLPGATGPSHPGVAVTTSGAVTANARAAARRGRAR
jgi:hypothetical protein